MRYRIGGFEFGNPSDGRKGRVRVMSEDPTGFELATHDSPRMGAHGVHPGRDFLRSAIWPWQLRTNARDAIEARELMNQMQDIWTDPDIMNEPGRMIALDYEIHGTNEWRRVYGRPRNFNPAVGDLDMYHGQANFSAEFEIMDPLTYAGDEAGLQEQTLTHEGSLAGGFFAPFTAPIQSVGVEGEREGALTNGGTAPTPLFIEFHGPVRNPTLRASNGWEVSWNGSLLHDERLVVDPISRVVTKYDGDGTPSSAIPGMGRRFRFGAVSLPAGMTNVFFTGEDPSHRSVAIVQWRDAYRSR